MIPRPFPPDPQPAHADRLAEAQAILDGHSRQVPNAQHIAAAFRELDELAARVDRMRCARMQVAA